jgi:low affinity Fe/Cu permease
MGQWWVTVASVFVVLFWLALGPFMHYSDTWQLAINTPTTIVEMWIGFLIAAAANRVERKNRELQQHQADTLQRIVSIEEQLTTTLQSVVAISKQLDEHVNGTAKEHSEILTEIRQTLDEVHQILHPGHAATQ